MQTLNTDTKIQSETLEQISPDETDGEDRAISTYLTRVIQAKCANCRKRETVSPDIMKRAVELFKQRGWRVRGIQLLCKECFNG